MASISTVHAGELQVAYERTGEESGWPVVLLHGFPYDVRCYDRVVPILADAGADVVVPYVRGYGPTAFVDPAAMVPGSRQYWHMICGRPPPTPRAAHAEHFSRMLDYRQLSTGHNTPQEDPGGFAGAVITLHRASLAG